MSIFNSLFTTGHKIKNVNGTFWNAESDCFGPECSATIYESREDLPFSIDDCDMQSFGAGDIRYYHSDDVFDLDDDAVASVQS